MSSPSYREAMESTIRREGYTAMRLSFEEVAESAMTPVESLRQAKSCLSIGCGAGLRDVPFIRRCLPNVRQFVCIEPDHDSVSDLRRRLKETLPNVEGTIFEATSQDVKVTDFPPVNVALLFHVLTHFDADDRKSLFSRLHNSWLSQPEGRLVIGCLHGDDPADLPETENQSYKRIGQGYPPWKAVELDLLAAGFKKEHEVTLDYKFDMTNMDHAMMLLAVPREDAETLSLEELRKILTDIYPNDFFEDQFHLAVYQMA